VKTWLVPVDVSIVEAVRGVSVLLPSSCRRRVPCVQTHVPTPLFPPFLVVVHGAVLTGTAIFFFYKLLYIDRAQSKIVIENPCRVHRNPSWSCRNYSRTPGCELPKGRHTHLVKNRPFYSDQMIPSRESLTRAFLSCVPMY